MQDDYGNSLLPSKTINERLQVISDGMENLRESLRSGDERMTRIEDNATTLREDMAENTKATKLVADNTAELVEIFESFKGAIKVLNWLGKLAKPMAYIASLFTALMGAWVAWRGIK